MDTSSPERDDMTPERHIHPTAVSDKPLGRHMESYMKILVFYLIVLCFFLVRHESLKHTSKSFSADKLD